MHNHKIGDLISEWYGWMLRDWLDETTDDTAENLGRLFWTMVVVRFAAIRGRLPRRFAAVAENHAATCNDAPLAIRGAVLAALFAFADGMPVRPFVIHRRRGCRKMLVRGSARSVDTLQGYIGAFRRSAGAVALVVAPTAADARKRFAIGAADGCFVDRIRFSDLKPSEGIFYDEISARWLFERNRVRVSPEGFVGSITSVVQRF